MATAHSHIPKPWEEPLVVQQTKVLLDSMVIGDIEMMMEREFKKEKYRQQASEALKTVHQAYTSQFNQLTTIEDLMKLRYMSRTGVVTPPKPYVRIETL